MAAIAIAASGCGAQVGQQGPVNAMAANDAAASDAATDDAAAADRPGDAVADDGSAAVYELEGMRIKVAGRDDAGEPTLIAYDAQSLLDRGNDALARGLPEAASQHYEQLLREFSGSRLRSAAIYNLGLAAEANGEVDRAIGHYEQIALHSGSAAQDGGRDSIDAHLRIAAVQAESHRWLPARRTLEAILARDDLTHSDRIEGLARLGYVTLEHGDQAAAERALGAALDYYDKLTVGLDSYEFVAMSRYYLAEVPHRQLLARPMRLPQEQLRRDLDAKAALLRLAYDRYVAVLEIDHAYWATAAGYQMSQLYKDFWDDIVSAPIPSHLAPAAAEYYRQELLAQVRTFLDKALAGHLRNVELAGVYQTSTVWSQASEQRAREITAILTNVTTTSRTDSAPITPFAQPGFDGNLYAPPRAEL